MCGPDEGKLRPAGSVSFFVFRLDWDNRKDLASTEFYGLGQVFYSVCGNKPGVFHICEGNERAQRLRKKKKKPRLDAPANAYVLRNYAC